MNKESEANALIVKQLKKFRKYKNISQGEIGSVIEVSNQQYSKIETGKNRIFAGQLFLISKHYHIDISCFYSDYNFNNS